MNKTARLDLHLTDRGPGGIKVMAVAGTERRFADICVTKVYSRAWLEAGHGWGRPWWWLICDVVDEVLAEMRTSPEGAA